MILSNSKGSKEKKYKDDLPTKIVCRKTENQKPGK